MKSALIAAIVSAVVAASVATATTKIVITGAQIKDGSIQAKDLSAKARRSLRGQRGARGRPGAFDPAGLLYVEGPPVPVAPGEAAGIDVECPSGTAISGGFVSGRTTILSSTTESDTHGGYHLVLALNETGATAMARGTVVCARS